MNDEEIEDGVFEEVVERNVILTKDLSDEDLKKIEESEMAPPLPPEVAAAFAKEMEDAQKEIKVIQAPDDKDRPLTQSEMIHAVQNAVKDGVISKNNKEKMLRDMGIFKSTFTKKATSKPTKAKKRKAARSARKKNRK